MRFINIDGVKLGNMRKPQDWTVTPSESIKDGIVTIQSDNRIARVNLNDGTAMLSDGKGGHQGFSKLNPVLGAKKIDVPQDVIDLIKQKLEGRDDLKTNVVTLIG